MDFAAGDLTAEMVRSGLPAIVASFDGSMHYSSYTSGHSSAYLYKVRCRSVEYRTNNRTQQHFTVVSAIFTQQRLSQHIQRLRLEQRHRLAEALEISGHVVVKCLVRNDMYARLIRHRIDLRHVDVVAHSNVHSHRVW